MIEPEDRSEIILDRVNDVCTGEGLWLIAFWTTVRIGRNIHMNLWKIC
jgi:hypothetical protein